MRTDVLKVRSPIIGMDRYLIFTNGTSNRSIPGIVKVRFYRDDDTFFTSNKYEKIKENDIVEYDYRLSRWYKVKKLKYMYGWI